MRLIKARAQGIRGFNGTRLLEFASGLTLIYGSNGTGKTSLGEALEWLLFGSTSKREKGDEISRREYKNSYRNIHYDGSDKPFFELIVELADGTQHTLRRELSEDESSNAYLDGVLCSDFSQLGVQSKFERPMILQHALQDFVYAKPKTRYRALSSMLGLESLIGLRGHVDKLQGKAGYVQDKPVRAKAARSFYANLELMSTHYPKLEGFYKGLGKGVESLQKARASLKALIADALGQEVPDDQIASRLRAAVAAKRKSVLDWQSFASPEVPFEDGTAIDTLFCGYAEKARGIIGGLPELPGGEKRQRTSLLKQFFGLGLQLLSRDKPECCPFCSAPTLTGERLGEIRQQSQIAVPSGTAYSELAQRCSRFVSRLMPELRDSSDVLPDLPDSSAKSVLREMLPSEASGLLEMFFKTADVVRKQKAPFEEARKRVQSALEDLQKCVGPTPSEVETPTALAALILSFGTQLNAAVAASQAYTQAYVALTPSAEQSISSQQEVQYLELLESIFAQWSLIEIAAHDIELEDSLLDFRRRVMEFIKEKQVEILKSREKDIKHWYEEFNPEEPVTFSGIDVATDALLLIAESYGADMHAAPNLSCSHLNCISLAVYLACATRVGSPFGFLFIDDPVQSMDEDHTEAFRIKVLQELLEKGYQIVVLTHLKNFASAIDSRYRRSWDLLRLDFLGYTKEGPRIEESLPRLEQYLKDARNAMEASNEDYRTTSVERLRRFVERFIKELHVQQTGKPISRRFRNGRWSDLKKLLLECKDFEPSDEQRLEDTHSFTSKHLHEDDALPQAVPKPHQIRVHVDDMAALLQKYAGKLAL